MDNSYNIFIYYRTQIVRIIRREVNKSQNNVNKNLFDVDRYVNGDFMLILHLNLIELTQSGLGQY